jgi:ketosteroid isomerase-like protein
MGRHKNPDSIQRLIDLYAAFNRRDIPALLAAMTPDVVWPNGWEGGILRGRDDVAAYWRRQWKEIQPTVEPTAFHVEPGDRVAVTVRQIVKDVQGATLSDAVVTHLYRFAGSLVAEMTIRD